MKNILIVSIIALTIATTLSISDAGWLIYHKPEFKGKVIDAETKEPIEGAVVVVVYKKHSLISGPGGGYTSVIKVKETLTDKQGAFYFPSYTTVIQPNSIEDNAEFLIYKPGYGSFPGQGTVPSGLGLDGIETFFSKPLGSTGELEAMIEGGSFKMITVKFGIVELPKLRTKEERLKAKRSADISGAEISEKELPILEKMIREERKALGFE